jgi:hypothetical protein
LALKMRPTTAALHRVPPLGTLERVGDEVEPRYVIHEVYYREDNDDHPVGMTPPIIDAYEDIRWIVGQIVRALGKPGA